jgi:HK97 family phage prohead protease
VRLNPEERMYRSTLQIRDMEQTGFRWLEGRAVPYDTWGDVGWFMEQHAQDSFKRSTNGGSGKRAPLLLFHDNKSFPIGHADSWTQDGGLNGVWKLNDSSEAKRAAEAADAGDLVGLSVGFMDAAPPTWEYLDWDDWNPDLGADHKDKVTRVESRLLEVSITPTPVFPDAEVTGVRSAYSIETRERNVASRVRHVDAWRAEVDRLKSAT